MTACVCRVIITRDPKTLLSSTTRTRHPECPVHVVPKPKPRA
jgi:hypothetical protein